VPPYTTQFGLPQSEADYLNQGLPSLSGIFTGSPFTYTAPTGSTNIVATTPGLTAEQLRLLYPQRDGGDGFRGGGAFGNLDMTNTKEFDVARYNEKTGEYDILDKVQGFYNPSLGQYQTFQGKNITHAGLNITPGIVSLIGGLTGYDFGPKQGDIGGIKDLAKLKNFIEIQKKEKKSQLVEDPSDFLERKERERKQKEYAKIQNKIGQSLHGGGGGGGGGNKGGGTFGDSVNDAGSFSDYS
jgi:hypothetical protein